MPDRFDRSDPFNILRLGVGALLLGATIFAAVLWLTDVEPRALTLLGALWALYGLYSGLLNGVLEPVTDFVASQLSSVGLMRAGGGYSEVETLAIRGEYQAAADALLERARQNPADAEPMVRRAALLAGPLKDPRTAVAELEATRLGVRPLGADQDIRVGLALMDIHDRVLNEPGRAMVELRRLLDTHPSSRRTRQIREFLSALKRESFPSDVSGER